MQVINPEIVRMPAFKLGEASYHVKASLRKPGLKGKAARKVAIIALPNALAAGAACGAAILLSKPAGNVVANQYNKRTGRDDGHVKKEMVFQTSKQVVKHFQQQRSLEMQKNV